MLKITTKQTSNSNVSPQKVEFDSANGSIISDDNILLRPKSDFCQSLKTILILLNSTIYL